MVEHRCSNVVRLIFFDASVCLPLLRPTLADPFAVVWHTADSSTHRAGLPPKERLKNNFRICYPLTQPLPRGERGQW